MTLINRLNLTQDEENCILQNLQSIPIHNAWYSVSQSILHKYQKRKYSNLNPQAWQCD